ncbi:hypothetical protein FACS1894103_1880 [Campylobacterota bacterium]|nr:hypothetical protein FACS1894103_1880 [Campylobacterota bacterium]
MQPMKFICAALCTCELLCAGWVIDEVTRYAGGDEFRSQIFIDRNRYKSQNEDETLIIDMAKDTIYFVYDRDKRYFGGKRAAVFRELRSNLRSEMAEDDAAQNPNDTIGDEAIIQILKTGEALKQAGFEGEKYQIVMDGELRKEIFVARTLTANSEIDPLKLSKTMLRLSGSDDESVQFVEVSSGYVELMKQGYPIRTIEYDPSGGLILTDVIKAEKRTFKADEFLPPKEYKQMKADEIYRR